MRNIKTKVTEQWILPFRRRLSDVDALPQLALLGLLSGLVTAIVIMLFRLAIEVPLEYFLPGSGSESFEDLDLLTRGLLPFLGAVGLGLLFHRLRAPNRKVGVVHVMERLNYHQGYLSLRGAIVQFIVGVATIVTGQSAGREGPAVHLGASVSSLMGQWMKLPNNSIRTLVACGCAAAISASFNTPIAGVIFAMEVVMMEYTIAGFTPIILAAVSSAVVTQAIYGTAPAFSVPSLTMNSFMEIPWIIAVSVVIGIAAAAMIRLMTFSARFYQQPVLLRLSLAGALMVPFALLIPEVMGIGYDTVNQTISNELPFWLLLGAALAKLVITAVTIGLGMPNGVIGPTLFIGATLGGAMGLIGAAVVPEMASSSGFYAMLGMGAMMGAVLQAPLAALMALLELTRNTNIILPGMLIIVSSSLIASEVFGQKSIFLTMLKNQGMSYQNSPIIQALRRVSVGAIMDRSILRSQRTVTPEQARNMLKSEPKWLIIEGRKGPTALMPAVDLVRYLETPPEERALAEKTEDTENKDKVKKTRKIRKAEKTEKTDAEKKNKDEKEEKTEDPSIDLMQIPANRKDIAPVQYQATLEEALQAFEKSQAQALYVQRPAAPMIQRIYGVVLKSDIESYYRYKGK
ncbi:MAG: chloride channel protein [Oleiphilaceae bacterium]|nr:chloride channel protein [Oleiphilaceae bacterium]